MRKKTYGLDYVYFGYFLLEKVREVVEISYSRTPCVIQPPDIKTDPVEGINNIPKFPRRYSAGIPQPLSKNQNPGIYSVSGFTDSQ